MRLRNFGDLATIKGQIAYFFIEYAQNGQISTSCQKSDVIVFADPAISYKMPEFWRFGRKYGPNCIFLLHIRETVIFLLPAKNLTSPSCSLTEICYKIQ